MAASSVSLSVSFTKLRLETVPFPNPTPLTHLLLPLPKSTTFPTSVCHRSFSNSRLFALINASSRGGSLRASDDVDVDVDEVLTKTLEEGPAAIPAKTLLWVLLWAGISLLAFAVSGGGDANAAVAADSSIKASGFGLKIASALRRLGWPDEAVVFALATLPVLELRGAIPVGYWMKLNPVLLTVLSVIGNMVPVPFTVVYLKRIASFLAGKNQAASRFLDMLFERAKEKAGPVEEFQWLGLMLFVAVPFPGTGAWTGAIIASVLGMPFWPAMSANFFGVVLAGLLVNLLVNLGLKYAIVTGIILFFVSTFMWSILRNIRKSLTS